MLRHATIVVDRRDVRHLRHRCNSRLVRRSTYVRDVIGWTWARDGACVLTSGVIPGGTGGGIEEFGASLRKTDG